MATPASARKKATPSEAPSNFPGPSGRPDPVFTFEKTLSITIAATTKYEIPSAAPNNPYGPGGNPHPLVNNTYSEYPTIGKAGRDRAIAIRC